MKYKYSPETNETFPCVEPVIETGKDDAIVLDGATDDQGVIFAEALNSYEETGLTTRQLAEQRAELLSLVKRYRNETPLGNQPHMIAIEADALIDKCEAKP